MTAEFSLAIFLMNCGLSGMALAFEVWHDSFYCIADRSAMDNGFSSITSVIDDCCCLNSVRWGFMLPLYLADFTSFSLFIETICRQLFEQNLKESQSECFTLDPKYHRYSLIFMSISWAINTVSRRFKTIANFVICKLSAVIARGLFEWIARWILRYSLRLTNSACFRFQADSLSGEERSPLKLCIQAVNCSCGN